MIATFQLLLFEAGYTAMWRSGPAIELDEVRSVMSVAADEQLIGWLYIGATVRQPVDGTATVRQGPRGGDPNVEGRITPMPAQPGQPAQASQPAQPRQPAQPGQASQLAQPGQASQLAQPGQASQPAQPNQLAQPTVDLPGATA
jgi:hypothetical protein